MYMHRFTRGTGNIPDLKKDILRTLEGVMNYVVTDATESELFALRVVREIFANAHVVDIEEAIKKVAET